MAKMLTKRLFSILIAAGLATLAGCGMDFEFPISLSDCQLCGPESFHVVRGFPLTQLDTTTYRGWIHVGQTVTLTAVAVRGSRNRGTEAESLAVAEWQLDDSLSARIARESNPSGVLLGIRPGHIGQIRALEQRGQGFITEVWACRTEMGAPLCFPVYDVSVVP